MATDNFFRINRGLNLNPQSGSDPAGTNGDIYYNLTLNKFRKYEDGTWSDLSSGGGNSGSIWTAYYMPVALGVTSVNVNFGSAQPDTSYVVFPMMTNLVDPNPQFQYVQTITKSTSGFTVAWNAPTDSTNYLISYIVPPKTFMTGEFASPSGISGITVPLNFAKPTGNYPILAYMQNLVDAMPQWQQPVITAKSVSSFIASIDAPTDSNNYQVPFVDFITAEVPLSNGTTSATINLPVAYGNANYTVVALMMNSVDAFPEFQPLVLTAQTSSTFDISWDAPLDSSNYTLIYLALSYAVV